MTLGERLLEYRTNLKISQDALAEKINVTRQTISKWETDQSTPEFNKILPLCEVFGITPDELIKGEKSEDKTEQSSIKEEENTPNVFYSEYTLKRNRLKGVIVSSSVFLYIIGTFIPAFFEQSAGSDAPQAIGIMVLFWAIATAMLIYFFLSHPKEDKFKEVKTKEDKEKKIRNTLERRIIEVVALFFLLIYLILSFLTGEWHITWILWLVLPIVELIIKIWFDLKRREDSF